MSHLFISYCHKDKKHLTKLISRLKRNGFSDEDIWYDKNIEAGVRWVEEIDIALEEAFALVVIVTPQSMQSQYVTYEWSAFLGNGRPVIPLLFEGDYDDIHKKLLQIQIDDCRKSIPSSLSITIKSHRTTFAETEYINTQILRQILRWNVSFFITSWFNEIKKVDSSDDSSLRMLVVEMIRETQETYTKLTGVIVQSRFAFTKKQLINLRELLNKLREFRNIFPSEYQNNKFPFTITIPKAKSHVEEMQQIIKRFYVEDSVRHRVDIVKIELDELANNPKFNLEENHTLLQMIEELFYPNKEYIKQVSQIIKKVYERKK